MLPRFSTSCLRATSTTKQVWLAKPMVTPQKMIFRSLYNTTPQKPSLTANSSIWWTHNNQISKRIFTTSKPTLIPKNTTTPIAQAAAEKKVASTVAKPEIGGSAVDTSKRNATDWAIIKQLMKYIWPKNDVGVKTRVVIALSLLVGGKVSFIVEKKGKPQVADT
jgi:hypothetical protein